MLTWEGVWPNSLVRRPPRRGYMPPQLKTNKKKDFSWTHDFTRKTKFRDYFNSFFICWFFVKTKKFYCDWLKISSSNSFKSLCYLFYILLSFLLKIVRIPTTGSFYNPMSFSKNAPKIILVWSHCKTCLKVWNNKTFEKICEITRFLDLREKRQE